MQQIKRFTTAATAHVDMQAEYGELLDEVTIERGDFTVPWLRVYPTLRPQLERMGAATADAHVELITRANEGIPHLA
ncbi:hypothetical protein D9M69_607000 [compost metagenome]